MPDAPEVDWAMHRNDDVVFVVTVKDSAGSAVTLAGASGIEFAMSKKKADGSFSSTAVVTKSLGTGITVTDAANGICEVALDSDDTESLKAPQDYYYEVEVTDSSGDIATVLIGTVSLKKDLILNP
jgi:hypothetical protein